MTHHLNDLVADLFSWSFAIGFVVGLAGERLAAFAWSRWRDRDRPHPPAGLNKVWVAGAIVFFIVGLVMVETQRNSNCLDAFREALVARSAIATDNDRLSRDQRGLLAENQRAEAEWIDSLLRPPTHIADLDSGDPAREAWAIKISEDYFEHAAEINTRIKAISDQQARNDEERARNPLPDPKCD